MVWFISFIISCLAAEFWYVLSFPTRIPYATFPGTTKIRLPHTCCMMAMTFKAFSTPLGFSGLLMTPHCHSNNLLHVSQCRNLLTRFLQDNKIHTTEILNCSQILPLEATLQLYIVHQLKLYTLYLLENIFCKQFQILVKMHSNIVMVIVHEIPTDI